LNEHCLTDDQAAKKIRWAAAREPEEFSRAIEHAAVILIIDAEVAPIEALSVGVLGLDLLKSS